MANDAKLEIIIEDIKRCEEVLKSNNNSHQLYQTLVAKYNGIFEKFEKDIPKSREVSFGGGQKYIPEINAIKEKLLVIKATYYDNDPIYEFKKLINEDIEMLQSALLDKNNINSPEFAKLQLYKEVTAKYHPYVPKLSDGLYNYFNDCAFYDEVTGEALFHNLNQIYNKLKVFKLLGYPLLKEKLQSDNIPIVQINNTNENRMDINVTFNYVRNNIKEIPALLDEEIKEILKKIDDIESIVKSTDHKSIKWEKAKDIIKWIADKGVDVGISLLPLLLKIN